MEIASEESGNAGPIERHLGNRLKELRVDRGLSETSVDALARLPPGTCKMLERGIAFFGPGQLYALARTFAVDPSFFFDGLPLDGIACDSTNTPEADDLIEAFYNIEDATLRDRIIGLIKAFAD